MAQFKDLFAELRRDTGLSQKEFAELFHQSGSAISSYETGRNTPSYEMLIRYADYFDVTTDYLIGRVQHTLSPTVLFEKVVDDIEVRDIIRQLKSLPEDRRRALCLMIDDLQFSATIHEKTKPSTKGD